MLKIILYCLSSLVLWSCDTQDQETTKVSRSYNLAIRYFDNTQINWREGFDSLTHPDSIYLFFEVGFSQNNVSIFLNGKMTVSDTLNTSPIDGLTNVYQFGKVEDIQTIGIRIDEGNLLLIEPSEEFNIWRIFFENKNLLVAQYSEHVGIYD